MSGENRSSTAPPPPPPPPPTFYAVYPVEFLGNINSGFQDFQQPQTPPPTYEDVISGEYPKSGYSRWDHPPTPTIAPTYQTIDHRHSHGACSCVNTAQSEDSSEAGDKNIKCSAVCNFLVILILIGLFLWRVARLATL